MPIQLVDKDHRAEPQLSLLRLLVSIQNELIKEVREAKARVGGLATEADREEYRQLCARMQHFQRCRETVRASALAAGASPRLVRKSEKYAERTFSGHY